MLVSQAPKHIILCPTQFWGHARPLAVLAARMVRMRPVVVTLCIPTKLYDRAKVEITSDFAPGEEHYLSLLRIAQGTNHLDPAELRDHFLELWRKLCDGGSIACESVDGIPGLLDFQALPPSALVIDAFGCEITGVLHEQRSTSAKPTNLHLYTWAPVSATWLAARPIGDPRPAIEAFAAREGISYDKAALMALTTRTGTVIESPRLPAMYDWEYEPQGFNWPDDVIIRIWAKSIRYAKLEDLPNLQVTDGMLSFDAEDYDPQASAIAREYYAKGGQELYFCGPLIPGGCSACSSAVETVNGQYEGLMKFMDEQLKARGPRSVIYFSFGSLFWPGDPAKLTAALDVLTEQKIPLVMSRPSPVARLPEDVVQRLEENPDVYLGDWLPQKALLDHPASGWCLTHGGHNTVLECIDSGVPMIMWPITLDQPPNAIYLSEIKDVAYELIQVRTGTGAGVIYRTGQKPVGTLDAVRDELRDVLERAFGADGVAKHQRLQEMRKTLKRAWSDEESEGSGAARRDVAAFLDHVCALPVATLVPNSVA
ncbi:UDP-Glycosyltransferase/glycogen phosphorylase [Trametes punicea]|nr:UDP-Glycosyltransferase/glycogen phosphorylase [Trametes punicea]